MKGQAGSSSHFVIVACCFESAEAAEKGARIIDNIKSELGWPLQMEIKFAKSSRQTKALLFGAISKADFYVTCSILAKDAAPNALRQLNSSQLTARAVAQALSGAEIQNAKIKIDGTHSRQSAKRLISDFKRWMPENGGNLNFKMSFENSQSNPLIQLADVVAGAIRSSESGVENHLAQKEFVTTLFGHRKSKRFYL